MNQRGINYKVKNIKIDQFSQDFKGKWMKMKLFRLLSSYFIKICDPLEKARRESVR